MKRYPDIDPLLVKCLLNEASAEEQEVMARWAAEDVDHRRYQDEFRRTWEEYGKMTPVEEVDENVAWERFRGSAGYQAARQRQEEEDVAQEQREVRKGEQEEGEEGGRGKSRWIGEWRGGKMAAAAAILLMAGVSEWWFSGKVWSGDEEGRLVALQAKEQVRTDTLPDGTQVTLNKNSTLTYPAHFGDNERKVRLKGEGYFEVVHNARTPFIVALNGVVIRDIGTSFDIRSANGTTEIVVESGMVEVSNGQYHLQASAGEKVVITDSSATPQKMAAADQLYRYYRTREFVCHKTPLWELAAALNEAYNVQVVIPDPHVRDLELTTTFKNENIDTLLNIVARSFQLSIERKGQQIVLKQ